jgi:hypothetical protein
MPAFIDLTDRIFGRWTVLCRSTIHVRTTWWCQCTCRRIRPVQAGNLMTGASISCGCYKTEQAKARGHNLKECREYIIFMHIIDRCENPHSEVYDDYGGRGITIAPVWRNDFWAFLAHVGARPGPEYSIDRIDNNRDYEPGNVRWATIREQSRNTRRNHPITFQGKTQCLTDWAQELHCSRELIRDRIARGWTEEDALTVKPYGRSAHVGEKNGRAIISEPDVLVIRSLHRHMTAAEVSKIFPIRPVTVSAIWARRLWKHIS